MERNDDSLLGLTHQMDQTGETLRGIAVMVANYHHALVQNGIPSELAAHIVRDWHWLTFSSVHNLRGDRPPH